VLEAQIQLLQKFEVPLALGGGHAPAQRARFSAAKRQREVLLDVHVGGSAHHRVLKHAAQVLRALVLREPGDVDAVDLDGALIHGVNPRHGVQERGLACAVSADYADKIPCIEGQVHAV